MLNIFTRLFGSRNQRLLRQYADRVKQANQFADELAATSTEGLRLRTDKLRARLVAGETLDAILPEAFATAREAATRAVNRERDGRAASFDCAIRVIPADASVDPKIRVGPPERTTRHTIRVIPPPCK